MVTNSDRRNPTVSRDAEKNLGYRKLTRATPFLEGRPPRRRKHPSQDFAATTQIKINTGTQDDLPHPKKGNET